MIASPGLVHVLREVPMPRRVLFALGAFAVIAARAGASPAALVTAARVRLRVPRCGAPALPAGAPLDDDAALCPTCAAMPASPRRPASVRIEP